MPNTAALSYKFPGYQVTHYLAKRFEHCYRRDLYTPSWDTILDYSWSPNMTYMHNSKEEFNLQQQREKIWCLFFLRLLISDFKYKPNCWRTHIYGLCIKFRNHFSTSLKSLTFKQFIFHCNKKIQIDCSYCYDTKWWLIKFKVLEELH